MALVTASFGGIDDPRPPPPHDGMDAHSFTDASSADACRPEVKATWTRIVVPSSPGHDFDPRWRGRHFKHQIHRLHEIREARWRVWADSTLQLHGAPWLGEP